MNKRAFGISLLLAISLPAGAAQRTPTAATNQPQPVAGTIWTEPRTGMQFVWIPDGCFNMGLEHNGEDLQHNEEHPVHKVCLKGYWMGRYEVTQAQYMQLMRRNPSVFGGTGSTKLHEGTVNKNLPFVYLQPQDSRNHPVEWVSYYEAQRYAKRMGALSKTRIALPSEAQWEYACRAGGAHATYCGGEATPESLAWYEGNSPKNPYEEKGLTTYQMVSHHPVGMLKANKWGLYDMSGNVEEWTGDCYHDTYQGAPVDGSVWKGGDCRFRVTRGGNWGYTDAGVTATGRGIGQAGTPSYGTGFRIIRIVQ